MFWLERSFNLHTDVIGLVFTKRLELYTNLKGGKAATFSSKCLGSVYFVLVLIAVVPQLQLCQNLVGEAVRHYKRRVTGSTT